MAKAVEESVRANFFAPEDFEVFIIAAAQRGETMKQVLSQLREPPAKPDQDAIPYMGDQAMYEQTIRVTAKDRIAINVGNTWYRADPGETEDQGYARLKRACFRTGRELEEVLLGLPSQVGSGGVAVPPIKPPTEPNVLFPPGTPPTMPPVIPTGGGTVPPPMPPVLPVAPIASVPIIRQSIGAKTGINLLGDIERWGLPDQERLTIATLTLRGLTVKELRELCTKLPPKLLAELQITANPDQQGGAGK